MRTPSTTLLAAALLATALSAGPAPAQSSLATYTAVREGLLAVWDDLPLTALNATLTEAPAEGYGQFTRRGSNAFAAGETVHVYAELIGYGAMLTADGYSVRDLVADLMLLDAEGNVRASQPGFFSSSTRTRQRLLETYLSFTVTLSAFDPGDYTLRYIVRDQAGEKETSFDLPITLTAGGPSASESPASGAPASASDPAPSGG